MLHGVIMAGGSGTRFWPVSRQERPKQFLALAGERTLIQQAADRLVPLITAERLWVVTNARHVEATRAQLPFLPEDHILVEPCGRNTAPCIGWAAAVIARIDPQACLVVTPADHVISPDDAFRAAVQRAVDFIEQEPQASVLFGVRPSYPATGFGYIEQAETVPGTRNAVWRVKAFREKPTIDIAEAYMQSGRYLWNCGIFVWRAQRVRELLQEFQPTMIEPLDRIAAAHGSAAETDILAREFPLLTSISIDQGVLEKAQNVFVLPATFGWDDVGSWQALSRLLGTDAQGNTVVGEHLGLQTRGCIIHSTGPHLVATFGVEDCIIVHTADATLVARKEDESALRQVVALLEQLGPKQVL